MLYRSSYIVAEDPASYITPNIEPVHIWSSSRKDIVTLRKTFFRQWFFASIELWIVIFLVSALYLGTGQNPSRYANNLDVAIVDFDGDLAGYYFLNAFQQSLPGNLTLNWHYKHPSDYTNNVDNTQYDVENGKVWAIVVLRPNTTRLINESLSALLTTTVSLTSPFASTLPILVTYEDGRNSFTVNNYVLPPIRSAIATGNARYGQILREELIANLSSSSSSSVNRNSQLKNVFQLGSLLAEPLSAAYQNLHPAFPFVGLFLFFLKNFSHDNRQ
jgi:hypothetical protein